MLAESIWLDCWVLSRGDDDPPCASAVDDDFFGGHDDLRGEGLGFSDQDLQILYHVGSEARQFEAKRVEARIDSAQDIFAEVRGEGLPDHAPALVSGRDGDAGKDGPGLIVDVTADGAGVGLGGEQNGAGQQQRGRGSRSTQRAPGARKTRTDKALIRHDVTLPIESTRPSRVAGKHWPKGMRTPELWGTWQNSRLDRSQVGSVTLIRGVQS